MKIKKEGFVYKVAYGLSGGCPRKTNLCKLFWRFLLMFFIGWPIVGIAYCAIHFIFYIFFPAIGYTLGFWIAHRPPVFKGDYKGDSLIPYDKWPTIKGWRVYPIYGVAVAFILFNPKDTMMVGRSTIVGIAKHTVFSGFFWSWVAGVAVFVILLCMTKAVKKSETYKMFVEFAKAKKQKICPTVEIVE
ncbi:MAG TPA: hypothetical protein VF817_03730 [Patescibacteria group bacterium]